MAQRLEVIKGGGGSIRIGTTGKIGSLITRELDTVKSTSQTPKSSRRIPPAPTVPVSVSCGITTRRLHARRASNQISSSSSGIIRNTSHKNIESTTRRNAQKKNTHRIPMLGSDHLTIERTPNSEKPERKRSYIAEVVDIKCGKLDRWSNPITNHLKKLSFSKLSESEGFSNSAAASSHPFSDFCN